jgi:hypothetical protein
MPDSFRIDRDLAIYFESEDAKFRPSHQDPEKVLEAVLRWEASNPDHPRREFAEDWIQRFQLPERTLRELPIDADVMQAFETARSFRQIVDAFAGYFMKKGTPEAQARSEAQLFVKDLRDQIKKGHPVE